MVTSPPGVWHLVARLPLIRAAACVALGLGSGIALAFPMLALPLRAAAPFGLVVAALRTLVLLSSRHGRTPPEVLFGLSLVFDVVFLTSVLDLTGGPYNPFILMYVVYAWLATTTASPRWGLLVGTIAAAGFAWLTFDHLRAGQIEHHRLSDLPTHLFVLGISLTAIAELVAHYVNRAHHTFQTQQRSLDEARARAARSEHQAALMTLAAGAAHELSTPLATIAVAARELERSAHRLPGTSAEVATLQDDARLIRAEVDRCQVVIDAMTGRATSGLPSTVLSVAELVEQARARLAEGQRSRLVAEVLVVPGLAVACGAEAVQAVGVLLKNAFDASGDLAQVLLRIGERGHFLRVEVRDAGEGMSPDVLHRVGEPFYTTKEPGRGTGLGVFLARAFAERMSGTLEFDVDGGTTAIMEIPLHPAGGSA